MTIYQGIEKREFLRVDYTSQVDVRVFQKDELQVIPVGYTKNVSACGLLFESDVSFPMGSILVVNLDLNTLSNVIEMDASVIEVEGSLLARLVRVEEYVSDKSFGLGLCFIRKQELSDEDDVAQIVKILAS